MVKKLSWLTGVYLAMISPLYAVEFNWEMLSAEDKANIDTSRFSDTNYVVPGRYLLNISVNGHTFNEYTVYFYDDEGKSKACLPEDIAPYFLLKENMRRDIKPEEIEFGGSIHTCLNSDKINGFNVSSDINDGRLKITIPEIYRQAQYAGWTPYELWDTGIPALLFDYSINNSLSKSKNEKDNYSTSAYGQAGVNLGPWRVRATYNAWADKYDGMKSESDFSWNDIYAYRPIPSWQAELSAGELYLNSNIFDSFRFLGIGLKDDERMLPPQLRGYSPTVTGLAKTNARVIIRHYDRIIYETTVPPGNFYIRDLDSGIKGRLDVTIIEENGETEHFEQYVETLPFLSRENTFRYNIALGKPLKYEHDTEDINVFSGELSYGLGSKTSAFGGVIATKDYQAYALGAGQDLGLFGTFSIDVTRSHAKLDNGDNPKGMSYRFNYSKRFDETFSAISFSGYRFSEREFMSLSQFMDANNYFNDYLTDDFSLADKAQFDETLRNDKSLFVVNFSQTFFPEQPKKNFYSNLSYTRETFWNAQTNNRLSLTLSKNWMISGHSLSSSLTFNNNQYQNNKNNSVMLSLSLNLDSKSNISYYMSSMHSKQNHNLSYYRTLDNADRFNGGIFYNDNNFGARAYYEHKMALADLGLSGSLDNDQSYNASLRLSGGVTATTRGIAAHPQIDGSSRILVDTEGVSGVPIEGAKTRSNFMGVAVVDSGSYYNRDTKVDFKQLPDDVEVYSSVKSMTLTDGAVGHAKFAAIQGAKRMIQIQLPNNNNPPFAATVRNKHQRELGIVGEEGIAYLAGLNEGETLSVEWNGETQCHMTVPSLANDEIILTSQCKK